MRKRPPKHGRLDSENVNISFNLGQSKNCSLMENSKVEDLDVTLNDKASFVDMFP